MDTNKPSTVEEFAHVAVENLALRAEREVPQDGVFAPVVERYVNHDKNIYANEMLLQITSLPVSLKNEPNYGKLRYLQAVVKSPLEEANRCVLACGTKEDILKVLNSQNLNERVVNKLAELAEDLRVE